MKLHCCILFILCLVFIPQVKAELTGGSCKKCEIEHGDLISTTEWDSGWGLGDYFAEEGDRWFVPADVYMSQNSAGVGGILQGELPKWKKVLSKETVSIGAPWITAHRVVLEVKEYAIPAKEFDRMSKIYSRGYNAFWYPNCSKFIPARASSDAENSSSPGAAFVLPPQMSNVESLTGGGGCSTCPLDDNATPGQFRMSISLGADSAAASELYYEASLASANLLNFSNLHLIRGSQSTVWDTGTNVITVRDESNVLVSTTAIVNTFTSGVLTKMVITVTPADTVKFHVSTHEFERVAPAGPPYVGLKYTRTENGVAESVAYYNLGVAGSVAGSSSLFGSFKTVDEHGNQQLWTAPQEVTVEPVLPTDPPLTFEWVDDASRADGGYFTGTWEEENTYIPALAGQPSVTTRRTYKRIGEENSSLKVVVSEVVERRLGATLLASETTLNGYDESYSLFNSANPTQIYDNSNFGARLWSAHSDGTWSLSLPQEVPHPYYSGQIAYADMMEFSPWKDGPALPASFADTADIEATSDFFAGLISTAKSSSYAIPGCKRVRVSDKTAQPGLTGAWSSRRVTSAKASSGALIDLGVEYEYGASSNAEIYVSNSNTFVPAGYYAMKSRSERWNAAGVAGWDATGAQGTWNASYAKSNNDNTLSLDHAGNVQIKVNTYQTDGTFTRDSKRAIAALSSGNDLYDSSRLPRDYTLGAPFPAWQRAGMDADGREVSEQPMLQLSGKDHTVQTITTEYTGETAYTRGIGTGTSRIVLASHGEDVVSGGLRTSTSTDAQGIVTVTVTKEATGELVSQTKQGVLESAPYVAQPDLITAYSSATDNTTGLTTQTVTQSHGATSRTLSVTVTDAQGRTKSMTDEIGRVTSYTYSSDGRTTTETLPGGLTRITETHLDGQLKRVHGTAVIEENHDYAINTGGGYESGSITHTVWYGPSGTSSNHWRKTTTNFLGQVLLEEQPSPATGGGVTVTQHFYNAKGQRVKTTRSGTAVQLVEYDDFGRVVKQGYDVDESGLLTATSADVLTETLITYEQVGDVWVEKAINRVHTQTDGNNALDTVTRRALAEGATSWHSTTSPDGSVMLYESLSTAVEQLRVDTVFRAAPGGTMPVAVQTSTSYNGLLVAQSLPEASAKLTFGYNGFGQMTSQVHPVAGTSTWTYDPATGQLLTQTAAGSSTVTYTYYVGSVASAGQVATVTANGEMTRYAYDNQGRKTHQWGAGSQPLRYVYDDLGRLHELHTYQGGTGWGDTSLPAAFSSATPAVTTWDYHAGTSALWKKTDASTEFVEYAYDSAHSGLLAVKTNARGTTTTYAYAEAGTGKKLPGLVTGLNYSDTTPDVTMTHVRGQLTTVADAAGLSTFTTSGATRTTTVTGSGLMTGLTLTRSDFGPDMPETVHAQVGGSTITLNQHQWNANGTLAKAWQGDRSTGAGGTGIRHVWGRNAATGRLEGIGTEAFGSGATHGIARGYTHTAGGWVEKIWYNAGTLGSPSTSIQGFDYDHDTHGRREVVAPYLPDNAPAASAQPPGWKYGYNERGEVTVADRFTAEDGPTTGVVTHQRRSYDYDLMGNRNTATQGANIGELNETGYTANILQQYDGITHTRLVEITGQAVAGATVELTLDGGTPVTVNRSLAVHQTGDPDSFRYVHTMGGTDARWLHVSIKASKAGIDLTRAGFTYVPPASESLDYDDDGNLTETAQWTYIWDAENRLTVAEQKSLLVASGLTAPEPLRKKLEFAYDSKNRRIAKVVSEWKTVGGTPQWVLTRDLRFVYDGWQMIAELDHAFAPVTSTGLVGSAVNRTFLWGPDLSGTMTSAGGVGGLLSTTYQGITYQVCSDANGNITGLVPVNGTGSGTLVARFDYDPFGNRVTNAGPRVELCPFGFSSKYLDVESGKLYYGFRYYHPSLGRWLSGDPIGEKDALNLYLFATNSATNFVDIDGRQIFPPSGSGYPSPYYNPAPHAQPGEARFPKLIEFARQRFIKDIDSWISRHCGETSYKTSRRINVYPNFDNLNPYPIPEDFDPPKDTTVFDDQFGDVGQGWIEATTYGLGSFSLDIETLAKPVAIIYHERGSSLHYSWEATMYLEDGVGDKYYGGQVQKKVSTWRIKSKGACCGQN